MVLNARQLLMLVPYSWTFLFYNSKKKQIGRISLIILKLEKRIVIVTVSD